MKGVQTIAFENKISTDRKNRSFSVEIEIYVLNIKNKIYTNRNNSLFWRRN